MRYIAPFAALSIAAASLSASQERSLTELAVRWGLGPELIGSAVAAGLWDQGAMDLDLSKNPYYIRGDFDGDGENDVAAYVQVKPAGEAGLAIITAALDTVHLFKASEDFVGEYFRVVPAGTLIHPLPRAALHAPRPYDDTPFRLDTEAIEVHYIGKSSGLYYWKGGQFLHVPLSD
jgi:hypothetical protein